MDIRDTDIYVCHYTKLKDRKIVFDNQLEKFGLIDNTKFITEHDYEELHDNELQYFDPQTLTLKEISLFVKHIQSWKDIVSSGKDYGIVMEDDCIFNDNFVDDFNNLLINYPQDFDILYTGVFQFYEFNPYPVPKNAETISNFHNMSNIDVFRWTGNNKGTDFYVISKNFCQRLIDFSLDNSEKTFFFTDKISRSHKINIPTDWWMGQASNILNANSYWLNTEITKHGSFDNTFTNSLADQRGF